MASVCDWDRESRLRRLRGHGLQKVLCLVCGETFETFHRGEIQCAKYCPGECRREGARRRKRLYRATQAGGSSHRATSRAWYRGNRERAKAARRAYRAADPEATRARRHAEYERSKARRVAGVASSGGGAL